MVKLTVTDQDVECLSFPDQEKCEHTIFRLDDQISAILSEISKDPLVSFLVKRYSGLRLIRQEPEQCIFSFVCATNTNIPMIRRMLFNLTKKLGQAVDVDGMTFFAFPSALKISKCSASDLRSCGLGYRVKAVKAVANHIVNGSLDFDQLKKSSYEEAKRHLLEVYGIGNKIADCVLLFSLEKLNAFPIDVWIARAMAANYPWLGGSESAAKLSERQYAVLSQEVRNYFGRYAGYAQQYLYYHTRQQAGRSW